MRKTKFLYIFCPIVMVCGLLFTALTDVAVELEKKDSQISSLKARLTTAEKENNINRASAARLPLVRYRDSIFQKKYPEFSKIVEVVYHKSRQYNVDPNLIVSMIHVESAFKPNAVSSAGAYGLMQINYAVWKDELRIKSNKIFDIEYNIDLGIKILKHYMAISKGDIMQALHLYNNGFLFNNQKYKYKVTQSVYY